MELSYIFPKKTALLYFLKKKFFLYFNKWNFLAPSLKNSHISGGNFPSSKNKKFLPHFWMTADQAVKFL